MKYPLAEGEQVHYAPFYGSVLAYMPPDVFIKLAPPLGYFDAEESQYINVLAQQIRDGRPLDAPELSLRDHDGRHRAWAAKIAGVEQLPVFIDPAMVEFIEQQCDLYAREQMQRVANIS